MTLFRFESSRPHISRVADFFDIVYVRMLHTFLKLVIRQISTLSAAYTWVELIGSIRLAITSVRRLHMTILAMRDD